MHKIFEQIRENVDAIVHNKGIGVILWQEFLKAHPADIATFFADLAIEDVKLLFARLPQQPQVAVFEELSYTLKAVCLSAVTDHDRAYLLNHLPIDELTDFFDEISDDELKEYLQLLTKKDRERVLSLLRFEPESAGGIMDTDILILMQDFTVEKSIQIMQRLQPSKELHRQIFVVDHNQRLVGFIYLEDLVLQQPKTRLAHFVRPAELVAFAEEDREAVAKRMVHYGVMMVPVVSSDGIFLGGIPSETLVEIIEEEASEDIYRMSALTPIKHAYLDTPFIRLVYQRGSILLVLLLIQTLSSFILQKYQDTMLCAGILVHLTMLISAGGNASSQSSALMIQGLATGELHTSNIGRFVRREFRMGIILAVVLSFFQFIRLLWIYGDLYASIAVSFSLGVIVMVAIMFGSVMPWLLQHINVDPAHSAGPVLATLMDVVGLLIFCFISSQIVG